jgi:hypothetical protein
MGQLSGALMQKGLKIGIKKAYGETFERLRANLAKVQSLSAEIFSMLGGTFKQLNSEYGFSLQVPPEPQMGRFVTDLDAIETSHLQYLSLGNAFKLAQPEFADRLVRALATRLRTVNESALAEIELWSKAAAAQLDAQMRERRKNFSRRIEAIDRIHQAAGGLEERIDEFEQQGVELDQLEVKLVELTSYLVAARDAGDYEPTVDLQIG